MINKERLLAGLACLVVVMGVFGSLLWDSRAGIIALLGLGLLIVALLTLQRRQLAKAQERLLELMRQNKSLAEDKPVDYSVCGDIESHAKLRKIFDMLQAQQVSIELLAARREQPNDAITEQNSQ